MLRQTRSGFISALILCVGLTAAIGAALVDSALRTSPAWSTPGVSVSGTTSARTVAQARVGAETILEPTGERTPSEQAVFTDEMAVVEHHPVPVTLVHDGQTISLTSAAATVGDLLDRQGVALRAHDRVMPGLATLVRAGMRVRVVRIERRLVTEQQQVQASPNSVALRTRGRIIGPRRIGVPERLYRITVADGTVVGRTLIGQRLLRSPLDRVIRVGTAAQLATDPLIGGPHLKMLATAYAPFCCRGVDNITATGIKAGYGVVAVDPTVIPLGSRLYVEGYGYAVAGDVGGSIKGLRIDLGFNTTLEALRYGVRRVRVYAIDGMP